MKVLFFFWIVKEHFSNKFSTTMKISQSKIRHNIQVSIKFKQSINVSQTDENFHRPSYFTAFLIALETFPVSLRNQFGKKAGPIINCVMVSVLLPTLWEKFQNEKSHRKRKRKRRENFAFAFYDAIFFLPGPFSSSTYY